MQIGNKPPVQISFHHLHTFYIPLCSRVPNPTTRPLPFPLSLPTLMLPVANGNPPHLHCIHPGHPSNMVSQTVHQAITIQFYYCAYLPSLRSTSPLRFALACFYVVRFPGPKAMSHTVLYPSLHTSTTVSQTIHQTIEMNFRQCGGAGTHGCAERSCRA